MQTPAEGSQRNSVDAFSADQEMHQFASREILSSLIQGGCLVQPLFETCEQLLKSFMDPENFLSCGFGRGREETWDFDPVSGVADRNFRRKMFRRAADSGKQ